MEKDPLVKKAIEIACQYDRVSASLLKRKLSIGYARAARILDILEELKVVESINDGGPPIVLIRNAKKFLKENGVDERIEKATQNVERKILGIDALLGEAAGIVSGYDKVAPSLLIRKLDTMADRVEEIMYQLEEAKVVGKASKNKIREVLIKDETGAREAVKKFIENYDRMEFMKMQAMLIEKTFESFGIVSKTVEVDTKPYTVEYRLEIAMGTSLEKILKLEKDLALALASPTGHVFIEAPIHGRALVGVTVPKLLKEGETKWSLFPGLLLIRVSQWLYKFGYKVLHWSWR